MSKINKGRYGFHNTRLSPIIRNTTHILAIDEKNSMFKPTLMEPCDDKTPEQLTQLYFWGEHGGVGGGDKGQMISAKSTLNFVVNEIQRRGLGLAIDLELVPQSTEEPTEKVEEQKTIGENVMGFIIGTIAQITGETVRQIESIDMVHPVAIKRYQECPEWRPRSLAKIEEALVAYDKEKLEDLCSQYSADAWKCV